MKKEWVFSNRDLTVSILVFENQNKNHNYPYKY